MDKTKEDGVWKVMLTIDRKKVVACGGKVTAISCHLEVSTDPPR